MYTKVQRGHLKTRVLIDSEAMRKARWGDELTEGSKHFLIADERVFSLYGTRVLRQLREYADVHPIVIAEGEAGKSASEYLRIAIQVSQQGGDRRSTLISLGGASTNNVVGFVAATVFRGVNLIHLPTTLLAQLDGAIDFKQAINADGIKNMMGAFYAPSLIVVDPTFLSTLPDRHISNGLAEGIKHALIQDEALLKFFLDNAHVDRRELMLEAIRRTVTLKVLLLQSDAYEDEEMLMQYGHAIGHALETATDNGLLHGEAVAIGMCVSAEVAMVLGVCSSDCVEAHYKVCSAYGLPTTIPPTFTPSSVLKSMKRDKYRAAGVQMMSLAREPGSALRVAGEFGRKVDDAVIREAMVANQSRALVRPTQ